MDGLWKGLQTSRISQKVEKIEENFNSKLGTVIVVYYLSRLGEINNLYIHEVEGF